MTDHQPAGAQTGTAESIAAILSQLAVLLEQEARLIRFAQLREGRQAETEATVAALVAEVSDLQERVARLAETIVHRLAERTDDARG